MRGQGRQLLDWKDNSPSDNAAFIFAAICIVLFAGCMSGLTLGLMSLDIVELEASQIDDLSACICQTVLSETGTGSEAIGE